MGRFALNPACSTCHATHEGDLANLKLIITYETPRSVHSFMSSAAVGSTLIRVYTARIDPFRSQ